MASLNTNLITSPGAKKFPCLKMAPFGLTKRAVILC
jgi:hypothetical protein